MDELSLYFRVLILEDEKGLREDLKTILEKTFSPRVLVDTAQTVLEGHMCIDSLQSKGFSYDLGILDLKLPRARIGENPELNTEIAQRLFAADIAVLHITAYADEGDIKRYIEDVEGKVALIRPQVLFKVIPKTASARFVQDIMLEVSPFFAKVLSKKLRRKLRLLLPDPSWSPHVPHDPLAHRAGAASRGECLTHAMIALHEDILQLWKFLSDEAKEEVKSAFAVVDLDGEQKRLSLFKLEPSSDAKEA